MIVVLIANHYCYRVPLININNSVTINVFQYSHHHFCTSCSLFLLHFEHGRQYQVLVTIVHLVSTSLITCGLLFTNLKPLDVPHRIIIVSSWWQWWQRQTVGNKQRGVGVKPCINLRSVADPSTLYKRDHKFLAGESYTLGHVC